MGLNLFGTSDTSRDSRRGSGRRAVRPSFRPTLDTLEDRTVPAVLPQVNLPIDVGTISVLETVVDGETVRQLQAPINIAGQQAGTLLADVTTTAGTVPVLNLHLDEIHLNLLGLHVDTSEICLDITARPGGGILGDLLGGLAGGLDLGGILGQLDDVASNVGTFLDGLEGLLDGVLGRSMRVTEVLGTSAGSGVITTQSHNDDDFCDILNLSLGPINLNLLGLNVALDNCATPAGPITVDVTADPDGGLLGGLLCGLADGNLTGQILNRVVGRLDRLIDRLGDLADQIGDIQLLPDRIERLADRLVDQLERFASRADSLADLDRVLTRIDQTVNRLNRLIENTPTNAPLPAPVLHLLNKLDTLASQLTRIASRFQDLAFINSLSLIYDRAFDLILAKL